ncbi:hypothetical protein EXIGLDRAFT_730792 [Exidia glandulosa HHB12029]|uniref:Uncharacterized protein n=1 Tax=Exidia glandulosa HHB12029 TaxID=1314781 RepID=A0A165C2G4_EXIGL|nr:hypothetical protein EXIGLDRAFT_730792 [Exidia glandulosa HHB12029]
MAGTLCVQYSRQRSKAVRVTAVPKPSQSQRARVRRPSLSPRLALSLYSPVLYPWSLIATRSNGPVWRPSARIPLLPPAESSSQLPD